jgi:hypothetical protein
VGTGENVTILERVEVFKYLARLLAQDNEDVQAIHQQLQKARGTWAKLGQILTAENTPPCVSANFYKAVIQSVLLYGSEMWNMTTTAFKQLEGFHIQAAYHMAIVNKPKRGSNNIWTYFLIEERTRGVWIGDNQHIHPEASQHNRNIHNG